MLPPSYQTKALEEQRDTAEKFVAEGLDNCVLAPEDVSLIGDFIRTFTFIELNLYRAVKLLREIDALNGKVAMKPAASDLTKTIRKGIDKAVGIQPSEVIECHLSEVDIGLPFRNLVAHWACSRLPLSDAFIFLTMDPRDAKALGDVAPSFDGIYYAVVHRVDMQSLLNRMKASGKWLAEEVVRWHTTLFPAQ